MKNINDFKSNIKELKSKIGRFINKMLAKPAFKKVNSLAHNMTGKVIMGIVGAGAANNNNCCTDCCFIKW